MIDIINWLDMDCSVPPAYHNEFIADWLLMHYHEIKYQLSHSRNDISDYLQRGRLKMMPQYLRDLLTLVFRKYEKRVAELEKEGGEYHPDPAMKSPYLGYSMMYPPYGPPYPMPHPSMVPPGYQDERMMSMMGMANSYYMSMGKYPYPQHYLPPYMGGQKYPGSMAQNPTEVPKHPYYPHYMRTYAHENPFMMMASHPSSSSQLPSPTQIGGKPAANNKGPF